MKTPECTDCKICNSPVPANYLIYANRDWLIRHSSETNILGYCILQSQRHFLDLSAASSSELRQYGTMLAAIMSAQREILQYDRVYTFSLAEAVPHFHVHVIPKSKHFPRTFTGRGIMSYPTAPSCDANLVATIVEKLKASFRKANFA